MPKKYDIAMKDMAMPNGWKYVEVSRKANGKSGGMFPNHVDKYYMKKGLVGKGIVRISSQAQAFRFLQKLASHGDEGKAYKESAGDGKPRKKSSSDVGREKKNHTTKATVY